MSMENIERQRLEALKILLSCATQYYVASGLHIDMDGKDGYGPLREARLFIEKYGSDSDKATLESWKNKWPRKELEPKK
jgi:hypothetical protein